MKRVLLAAAAVAALLANGCAITQPPGASLPILPSENIPEPDLADFFESYETAPAGSSLEFRPPLGFGKYKWGMPLSEFPALYPFPLTAQTYYSRGKVTDLDINCISRNGNDCDLDATLRGGFRQRTEGEGLHTMAEYAIDRFVVDIGLKYRGSQVTQSVRLHPIFWQFCHERSGSDPAPPADIGDRLSWCGLRMYFKTETPKQLAQITEPDYETAYDQILRWLVQRYGAPEDYDRHRVIITTPNERIADRRKHDLKHWRWCPVRDRELAPYCASSIVLAYDKRLDQAVILFATAPVWRFAFAQHNGGTPNEPLYQLLHGRGLHTPDDQCLGSRLSCSGRPRDLSLEELERFRVPGASGHEPVGRNRDDSSSAAE